MTNQINARISWSYEHYLNLRSKTWITKEGILIKKIKHRADKTTLGFRQMALVKFDGNKNASRIPFNELNFLDTK